MDDPGWFSKKPAPLPTSKKLLNKLDYFQKEDVLATVRAGRNVTTSNWVGAFFTLIVLCGMLLYGVVLYQKFQSEPPISRSEVQWSAGMSEAPMVPIKCLSASGCLVGLLSDPVRSAQGGCRQKILRDSPWLGAGCRAVAEGQTVEVPLCYSGTKDDGIGMVWPSGEGGVAVVSDAAWNNGSMWAAENPTSAGHMHVHYVITNNASQPAVTPKGEKFPTGRLRHEYFTQHISPDINTTALCPTGLNVVGVPAQGSLLVMSPMYTRSVVEAKGNFLLHFIAEIGGMSNILTSVAAVFVSLHLALAASVSLFQRCIPQVPDADDEGEPGLTQVSPMHKYTPQGDSAAGGKNTPC